MGVSYTHASPDEPTEPAYQVRVACARHAVHACSRCRASFAPQVSLELREWGREVVAGYYQHIVTQRRVHNPFEKVPALVASSASPRPDHWRAPNPRGRSTWWAS